jgi:arginase
LIFRRFDMNNFVLPVPFFLSPYNSSNNKAHERILYSQGSNENSAKYYPNNIIVENSIILPAITNNIVLNNNLLLNTISKLQTDVANTISSISEQIKNLLIVGGDHSISIGTGLGLASFIDMSEVALIWIDAHADSNTPETSLSKSFTGYPVAINCGFGHTELTEPFYGNFIDSVSFIGLRDVEKSESEIIKKISNNIFSVIDVEKFGLINILNHIIDSNKKKRYFWLSIDFDCLDPIYLQEGEIDLPTTAGLSPRELLLIAHTLFSTGKLLVTELTQLNDINKHTQVISLATILSEIVLGLGSFRFGK